MTQIIWTNIKIYSKKEIDQIIKSITSMMCGLIPIYFNELIKLKKFATESKYDLDFVLSMRNLSKIQIEIYKGRSYYKAEEYVKQKFIKYIKKKSNIEDIQQIKLFYGSLNQPIHSIIKTISATIEFKSLSAEFKNLMLQIKKDSDVDNQKSKNRSVYFENILEKFLDTYNIKYKTETEIKLESVHNLTPDILFDKPIQILVNDVYYNIYWIDAKNYCLIDLPFVIKSLKEQAKKYNAAFGPGAFVFSYGFESGIEIDNVLILDGTFMNGNKI